MSYTTNENEDWLKGLHWDLPTNVDYLAQLVPLEDLVRLPVWNAAPPEVRHEVERRLS